MLIATIKVVYDHIPYWGAEVTKTLQTELDQVADRLLATMRVLVPVDTGALRDGLYVETERASRLVRSYVAVKIMSEQYYWVYVEYGTVHAAAQPFIDPAVRIHRPDLMEATRKAMVDASSIISTEGYGGGTRSL
jgi:HK97 gp10 family phage protein